VFLLAGRSVYFIVFFEAFFFPVTAAAVFPTIDVERLSAGVILFRSSNLRIARPARCPFSSRFDSIHYDSTVAAFILDKLRLFPGVSLPSSAPSGTTS